VVPLIPKIEISTDSVYDPSVKFEFDGYDIDLNLKNGSVAFL
jgi:hypothetical protein